MKPRTEDSINQVDLKSRIYRLRGRYVMLGPDLAQLYEVRTKVLMQAVRRNLERFPPDFMFRLTWIETASLHSRTPAPSSTIRSQFVTLPSHSRFRPYAFTEEGIAMLSAVLKSELAIKVSIGIMRAFIKLRHAVLANQHLSRQIEKLEGRLFIAETDIRLLQSDVGTLKEGPREIRRRIAGFATWKKGDE